MLADTAPDAPGRPIPGASGDVSASMGRGSGASGAEALVTGILVPIDGSEASFAALPVAAALAAALGVEIRVVQAVADRPETDPPLTSMASSSTSSASGMGIAHPDTIEREFRGAPRAAAEAAVAEALIRLRALGVTAAGDVLTGNPVAAVISEASRTDLVVLTSRGEGRSRTNGSETPSARVSWTLGGVADNLLRAGTAPIVLAPASTGTGT